MPDPHYLVRASRADPPGHAKTGERKATYGAALAQFDELMAAAQSATAASRPLPLFYALSQAGRAISAALADEPWRLKGHGLSTPDLGEENLLNVTVRRRREERPREDVTDSFTGVAGATGSADFESVTLGELWGSLPEVFRLLPEPRLSEPLLFLPDVPDSQLVPWERAFATIVGFVGEADELVPHLLAHFPRTEGVHLYEPVGVPPQASVMTEHGPGLRVWWEAEAPNVQGHIETFSRIGPGTWGFDPRWLRPAVGGAAVSDLLTWWALLFGLSMLARYEPARWTAALDLDGSKLAAPLRELLSVGLQQVPELVIVGLTRRSQNDG